MHSQTKEGKERSKEGISRVKCKIFNPPSINQPCRDGNTTCTVHLRQVGVGMESAKGGRGLFSSSSPRIQLSIFLNDVIAVALSLHCHLHLLPRSILPELSASCTHKLAHPPICTYTCATSQYMMHPVGKGWIHRNRGRGGGGPNCFEISSKRMQPARKCFTVEGKPKITMAKSGSHILFLWVDFFFLSMKYVKMITYIGVRLKCYPK